MAITVASLGVAAGLELDAIFSDSFDVLQQGEAQYLKDGTPESISGQLSQAAGRSACRIYGTGSVSLNARAAARYENACRPYLDTISPGGGPRLATPFQGGQCDGVPYVVNFTTERELANGTFQAPVARVLKAMGPIGGFSQGPFGSGTGLGITSRGSTFGLPSYTCPPPNPPLGNFILRTFLGNVQRVSGIAITACGPDGCGSPPPTVRPPVSIPNPTGPTFRFNPSADIDVPITVELFPDGKIIFDIGGGDIEVDPFAEGGGEGEGGGGDDPPGDVGEADESGAEDADENGNASGCAGENQVLGGLKIAITTIPDTARFYAPGIVRGACYLYMGSEGNLDQDFGGSMLRDGQFFLPEKENLTCWEVQANLGFRLRVTPYYKTLEEE